MVRKPAVTAAGTVCFRVHHGIRQVLLVHRPAYGDWTLPKGKPQPDEDFPVAAVRETYEETGVRVRLGLRLSSVQYSVSKGRKVVHFWVGQVLSQRQRKPDDEVDKVKWFSLDEARRHMTYGDEIKVLDEALTRDSGTVAAIIVRHGKAMDRKNWSGPDQLRTLSARGRRQSERLVDLLAAYGVEKVLTSSSKRCVLTVKPFCHASGVPLEKVDLLTEESAEGHYAEVAAFLAEQVDGASIPVAFCGHRPVLPAMQTGLGVEPRPMLTGEALVVHFRAGELVGVESHKSAF